MAEPAVANNMFAVDDVDGLTAIFKGAVSGKLRDHRWWMSVRPEGTVIAAAYVAPEQYTGAREFYRARGFDEEARIRDFYGPGDDKVVFWKALIAQ